MLSIIDDLPYLRAGLRHELRSQRLLLAIVALGLPLAGAIVGLAWPDKQAPSPPLIVGASALLAAALLGSELMACELRGAAGASLELLRRSPAGLGLAALAKSLVLMLGLAVNTLATSVLLTPAAGFLDASLIWLAATAVGMLMLAISTWLPQASLTLPSGLMALGLLSGPSIKAWLGNPWVWPDAGSRAVFFGLVLPFVAVPAWFASARAMSLVRPSWRVAVPGLALAVSCALPGLAWQAHASSRWDQVRPSSEDFWIDSAYLSPSGRFAWLNCRNKEHATGNYCLRVDLVEHSIIELGDRNSRLISIPSSRHVNSVVCRSSILERMQLVDTGYVRKARYDAESGAELDMPQPESMPHSQPVRSAAEFRLIEGQLYRLRASNAEGAVVRAFPFPGAFESRHNQEQKR